MQWYIYFIIYINKYISNNKYFYVIYSKKISRIYIFICIYKIYIYVYVHRKMVKTNIQHRLCLYIVFDSLAELLL